MTSWWVRPAVVAATVAVPPRVVVQQAATAVTAPAGWEALPVLPVALVPLLAEGAGEVPVSPVPLVESAASSVVVEEEEEAAPAPAPRALVESAAGRAVHRRSTYWVVSISLPHLAGPAAPAETAEVSTPAAVMVGAAAAVAPPPAVESLSARPSGPPSPRAHQAHQAQKTAVVAAAVAVAHLEAP